MEEIFVDIECVQEKKYSESAYGDFFLCKRIEAENRVVAVLSDGLGSGIKANVLSSMTAHMALKFIASDSDIMGAIKVMIEALPVCRERRISYATFTIVDYTHGGKARVIEMENPQLMHMRGSQLLPYERRQLTSSGWEKRKVYMSELAVQPHDRLVFCSDGVSQAGLGSAAYPLGWRENGMAAHLGSVLEKHPDISARAVASGMVSAAVELEEFQRPYDDISCAVMHFRTPRKLLLVSGPPYDKDRDAEYARRFDVFDGRRVVCGGTSSNIISRELGCKIETEIGSGAKGMPPVSRMKGAELVTEGILTLSRTAVLLEEGVDTDDGNSPAQKLAACLTGSDMISFLIGTSINTAHQDPDLMHGLDIRRNVVERVADILKNKYLKKVRLEYI